VSEDVTLDEKMEAVRSRIHNLNDVVVKQGGDISEHAIHIRTLKERVDKLTADVATGEQLEAVKEHLLLQLSVAKMQLEGSVAQINLKLMAVSEKLDPIQRGIWWVVTLILGAVILAVLGLVLGQKVIVTKP